MENPVPSALPSLEELSRELLDLRARVSLLEQHLGLSPAAPASHAAAEPAPPVPSMADTAGLVSIAGRALLGIAGAYLLRAVTEFGVLPRPAGVTLGLIYALLWLLLAARTPAERKLEVAVHGFTSVLVLAPLLWEAVVRFHALPAPAAAGVLVFFTTFGLAISWRKNLATIAWITTLAGLLTAVALLIATHNVVPFTAALLAIAVAVEVCACLDHWLPERWVVAALADLSVLFVAFLVTRQAGLPDGYAPISTSVALTVQIALLAVYLASTVVRTLAKGYSFTAFEITQCAVAFLISVGGTLRIARGDATAGWAAAAFTLLTGVACYVVSFAFLERRGSRNRNFYTYSTFGLLLTLIGTRIALVPSTTALVWSIIALLCIWFGARAGRTTLRLHGAAYLLLAAAVSGLAPQVASRLLSSSSSPLQTHLLPVLLAACLGYAFVLRDPPSEQAPWPERLFALLVAFNCLWGIAGLIVGLLIVTLGRAGALAPATISTVILVSLSLTMAWFGARRRRFELVWLVYVLMTLTAYKLLARDLQQGHTLALFLSLLFYGGALVLLPRLLKNPSA